MFDWAMQTGARLMREVERAQLVRLIARRTLEALTEGPLTLGALKKRVLDNIPQRGKHRLFRSVLHALVWAGVVEEKLMLCRGNFVTVYVMNEEELRRRWWLRVGEL